MARKALTLTEKLAALALDRIRDDAAKGLVPGIPSYEAVRLTPKGVLVLIGRLYQWHHVFPVGMGGDNRPFNVHLMLRGPHRERTPDDTRAVAKFKRGAHARQGRRRQTAAMPYTRAADKYKRKFSGEV